MQEINRSRRNLLKVLPLSGVAAVVPSFTRADTAPSYERARMLQVIEQLERFQDWETTSAAAAKAFAAWQMRKALGCELPDPKIAQMHIDLQRQKFEVCREETWFKQDQEAGANYNIAPAEKSLM
jgi:hypothetical protein